MSAGERCILVTAATTPIGRATVAQIVPHARVLGVHSAGEPAAPPHSERASYVSADLTRLRDVRELLFGVAREHGVDGIVAVAPHAGISMAQEPRRAWVETARNLLGVAEEQAAITSLLLQSSAAVYRTASDQPVLFDEDQPLDFSVARPARERELLETDVLVSAKIGTSRLRIAVLRLAEVLATESGSSLYDYLSTQVCIRPLGYDPMLNVLSLEDAGRALAQAALQRARGIFNVPGADTLPLSELIHRAGRVGLVAPGPLLRPLYAARAALVARSFRYLPARARLHYAGILDGRAAKVAFGYAPAHRIALERLFSR